MRSDNVITVAERVRETIQAYDMIKSGDSILVAVSGGADSVCLLHILNKFKDELGFKIYAAHVNHRLRGELSDGDEAYVKELCRDLGMECYSKRIDIGALAEQNNETLEECGRRVRYEFFKEIREKHDINKIATAHNMDDQAETVLMRIMRGTGLDGLRGIQYVRFDGVIRPLLDVKKRDIADYCAEFKLDYRTDGSNADTSFTRNRIRVELIPYLEASFNQNITEALAKLAQNCALDSRFLNDYAGRLYKRLSSPLPQKKPVCLHIPSIVLIDGTIVARLIKQAAKDALGFEPQLESKHIKSITELIQNPRTGAVIDLPNGLSVCVNYDWLTFESKNEQGSEGGGDISDFSIDVEIGEEYYLEKLGYNISLSVVDIEGYKKGSNEMLIDYSKVQGKKLSLRTRADGDRIAVYKDGRDKKIKKLFIDLKIPRGERDKKLVLLADGEAVGVLGVRVSEKYKIDKTTEKGMSVRYGAKTRI